ncbi:9581_t:CDS:2 [Ambispora gerdemannii]|uniref:9581_t:CDS:1 n=1 Tax=Ambispora gerdemannii TaxID=144530 RepID=A0A9N9F1S8_9GLOM|nr:9581_t:CDS:2 [Ambispora gerdemannii]
MLSAASNAASAIQSSIMDTLNSRQNSETVISNNGSQDASDSQVDNSNPRDSKLLTNGEEKSSPTINLDTTVAMAENQGAQVAQGAASLTIEQISRDQTDNKEAFDYKLPYQQKRVGSSSTSGTSGTTEDKFETVDLPPAQIPKHSPASPKRHKEFHSLFRNVPEYDYLIDDYSCALQKEILVQGRLYISVNYACFNANIFGWVTSLVIPFSDIVSIEKRVTAFVIPNAILISTLHAKHFFASFLARDTVYDLLTNLWRQNRPTLSSTPSFAESEFQNDKSSESEEDEEEGGGTEESEVDEGKQKNRALKLLPKLSLEPIKHVLGDQQSKEKERTQDNSGLLSASKQDDSKDEKVTETGGFGRDKSTFDDTNLSESHLSPEPHKVTNTYVKPAPRARKSTKINTNVKKRTHSPVLCDCLKNRKHYDSVSMDTKFTGSVEKLYNLIFTSGFVRRFLVEQEKCTDDKLTRTSSYIRPLTNPMGPKSTKCYLKDECLHRDFDRYVTNFTITNTPDVPYGSYFSVKTRTCIMWAGANETRIIVSTAVEFSKSSWIKGTIERAALDGQLQYHKNLALAIRKYIAAHPNEFQDECGSPVREVCEIETQPSEAHKGRDHESFEEDGELGIEQEAPTNLGQAFVDLFNALTAIFSSIFRIIGTPSKTTLIACAFVFMVVTNFYNWLRLTDLTHKLENAQSGSFGSRFGSLKPDDVLYESRRFREYALMFDDRVNSEGDHLWVWVGEKAKKHGERKSDETNTSESDETSSTITSDSTQSSSESNESNSHSEHRQKHKTHFMNYFDRFNENFGDRASSWSSNSRRYPSASSALPNLSDLYGQIEDLQRLVHAAQYHANKLADIAEEERSYLFQLEKNMLKNSNSPTPSPSANNNHDNEIEKISSDEKIEL